MVSVVERGRRGLGRRARPAFLDLRQRRARGRLHRILQGGARRNAAARRAPKPEFPGGAIIGVNRQAVVADTVEDARRIAKPAFDRWYSSLSKLERENQQGPRYVHHVTGDMESALKNGQMIVGTPETVAAEIRRQVQAIGVNYMNFSFFFGTMKLADALRSLTLFAKEVMPKVTDL